VLNHLFIRDFAIVSKLELAIEPGLTVLTGETGAGKSILIDALALALGERAEMQVIRHGSGRAEVAAGFDLGAAGQDAARWLREHDLFEDGECLLRRVVERDKGSKAWINGRPVPVQMLRELGELLVDIHGQHEHQSLLKRDAQRQMLDDFAGLATAVGELGANYHTLRELEARRATLGREGADRTARIDYLRHQVQELDALKLAPDEIPQLEDEHKRAANSAELVTGAQGVAQSLYDDEEHAVSGQLARAIRDLENLSEYDAKLGELVSLLNEASVQVDEVASRLHQYLDTLDVDPQRLEWLENRIGALHDLSRKHQVKPEELPAVLERLRTELADIEDYDVNLEKLDREIAGTRAAYLKQAKDISRERATAATRLGKDVTAEMQKLGMPGGRFEIALLPLANDELSAHGLERIEYQVSANTGQPVKALTKVASGGELSRISLALQVVTARIGRIPSLIFDEVDVGIGGGVAEVVGAQLRTLADSRQVLCITHLAQVAAQGHHHLQVTKETAANTTVTHISPLTAKERVHEIARMLGGVEITRQTLDLAAEMLSRVAGTSDVPA
jgi:DNA repair protein RecN (Recombination protein N)